MTFLSVYDRRVHQAIWHTLEHMRISKDLPLTLGEILAKMG